MRCWMLGVLALGLVGCSGGDDDGSGAGSIPDSPLSGKVGGQSWTFTAGTTDAFLSDPGSFWIDLYSAAATCDGAPPSGNSLIVIAPRKTGTYTLGSSDASATFVVQGGDATDNFIADGRMSVDSVSDTKISGGLAIQFDVSNSVQGKYEASICP